MKRPLEKDRVYKHRDPSRKDIPLAKYEHTEAVEVARRENEKEVIKTVEQDTYCIYENGIKEYLTTHKYKSKSTKFFCVGGSLHGQSLCAEDAKGYVVFNNANPRYEKSKYPRTILLNESLLK